MYFCFRKDQHSRTTPAGKFPEILKSTCKKYAKYTGIINSSRVRVKHSALCVEAPMKSVIQGKYASNIKQSNTFDALLFDSIILFCPEFTCWKKILLLLPQQLNQAYIFSINLCLMYSCFLPVWLWLTVQGDHWTHWTLQGKFTCKYCALLLILFFFFFLNHHLLLLLHQHTDYVVF